MAREFCCDHCKQSFDKLTPQGQEMVYKLRSKILPYLERKDYLGKWEAEYLYAGLTVLEFYGWKRYLRDKEEQEKTRPYTFNSDEM